jgi:hypothetical protein
VAACRHSVSFTDLDAIGWHNLPIEACYALQIGGGRDAPLAVDPTSIFRLYKILGISFIICGKYFSWPAMFKLSDLRQRPLTKRRIGGLIVTLYVAYLIKSALGISLLPGFSAWRFLKLPIQPIMEARYGKNWH